MRWETLCAALFLVFTLSPSAFAQPTDSCTTLMDVKVPGVEITKAAHAEAGSTEPIPWNQSRSARLPAYCRVEGVIHRRTGVGLPGQVSGGWLPECCLGSVIPFTLIVILPTNKRLVSPGLDRRSAEAERLLARWGSLHAVRSVLSTMALLLFLYLAIFGKAI
jgi:anthrone oxygenase-like protein